MRGRLRFWARRYGPAELVCQVTMLAASAGASRLTTSPPVLAACAIAGATVGFYGVLGVSVAREQRRLDRTILLLATEFGVAEVLDTLVWRPALMIAGVILLGDAMWGLLAGKVLADLLFYLAAAVGYRVSEITGLRHAYQRQGISHM